MSARWLVIAQPRPNATRRFFVFHHAGASASAYSRWNALVPEDTELVLIELPGRALRHREPFYRDLDSLVEDLAKEFTTKLDRPYALFGHSMGALIALHLARWIERQPLQPPLALVVSAFDAPTDERLAARVKIGDLGDFDLIKALDVYDGLPKEVTENPSYLKYFLNIIRADVQLLESYSKRGEPRLAIPIFALVGHADASASLGGAQSWSRLTRGPVCTKVFEGAHFYLLQRSAEVLRHIFESLDSL